MATTTTLAQLRTQFYQTVKQPENCKAYPYTLVDPNINKSIEDIVYGDVTDPLTGQSIDKQAIPFTAEVSFFTSVQQKTITSDAVVGAITLDLDTTGLSVPGVLWLEGNLITYTGITGTQATGIPPTGEGSIKYAWQSGSRILQAYAFPTDYGQMTMAYYITGTGGISYRMIGVDYREVQQPSLNQSLYRYFRDDFQIYQREFYYTIINDKYFLPMLPQSGNPVRFEYQKKPNQLVNAADICIIPDEDCLVTVPFLTAAKIMPLRGETQEGMNLYHQGFNNVMNFYRKYQKKQKELIFGQRVRSAGDGQLNI